jgi:hypothetical protein
VFDDKDQLAEGGVWITFRDSPPFLENWLPGKFYPKDEVKWSKDFAGAVLAITEAGVIFTADPDPLEGDWRTYDPGWRQVLVPWANVVQIEAKHAS